MEVASQSEAERRSARGTTWATFLVTLVLGSGALLAALGGLREAHLYRQRSGEGLGFLPVAVGLVVAGGFLAAAAWSAAQLAPFMSSSTGKRAILLSSALIVVGLTTATGFVVWVEAHDDRCVGSCR